jgi:hypothetical protein
MGWMGDRQSPFLFYRCLQLPSELQVKTMLLIDVCGVLTRSGAVEGCHYDIAHCLTHPAVTISENFAFQRYGPGPGAALHKIEMRFPLASEQSSVSRLRVLSTF